MELNVLIAECTAYDFKVMLEEKKPKSWLKSVSAFANGSGGSLLFGIDNDGRVKGLDDVQHVCETISSRIRDYMDPLPEVEMIPHDIEGLHILQLKVNAGHYTPYYYVGDGHVQDLSIEEIASDRRNPILADVMAQLDYMEKRGSGLKRICIETKALDGYKEDLKPVFLSTASQFMTTIYSMGYELRNKRGEQYQDGIKPGLSWAQVGTKTGLSWDEVEKLFVALQEPTSMGELKDLYGWANTTKFKVKFVSPLIEEQFVSMTSPDKPTSPKQRYFLTDRGKALLANMICDSNTNDLEEKVNHIIENLNEDEKRLALDLLNKDNQDKRK